MKRWLLSCVLVAAWVVGAASTWAAPTVIRVQDPDGGSDWATAMLKIAIANFEAQNPNIKVELDTSCVWNGCKQKTQVEAAAGTAPDVLFVYGDVRTSYIRQGMLLDLTPYIQSDPASIQTLLPPLKQAIQYNGHYYGMPEMWFPVISHINLDKFHAAGLPAPKAMYDDGDWTFAKLPGYGAKLTKRNADGKITEIGLYGFSDYRGLIPWVWGYGASLFNEDATQVHLDDPGVSEAINYVNDLINKDQVLQMAGLVGSAADGRWGILFWNPVLFHLKYEWKSAASYDVLPYPSGPAGDKTQGLLSRIWAVSSATTHPDAAWKFVEFLGGVQHDKTLITKRQAFPLHVDNLGLALDVQRQDFGVADMGLVLNQLAQIGRTFPYPFDARVTQDVQNALLDVWKAKKAPAQVLQPEQKSITHEIASLLTAKKQ